MVNLSSVARLKNSHQGNVNYQRKARGLNQQVKERCLALNLSEGRTFPFFHLVLSLLGSQSYLGCCYLKAEPFFFFSPGSASLVQSVLFGLLLSKGSTWLCLSWVVSPIWAVIIYRQNLRQSAVLVFSMRFVRSIVASRRIYCYCYTAVSCIHV